jgi:O-methyltransferase
MMFNKFLKSKSNERSASQPVNNFEYCDVTDYENQLIAMVTGYTMTSKERIISLIRSVIYILDNNIPGDFVECGVWKGGSAMIIAKILKDRNIINRKLYLYDTFDGMVAPQELDKTFDGQDAAVLMNKQSKSDSFVWAYSPEDEVKRNLAQTEFNSELIFFIKGDVCATLLIQKPSTIALLRLDTDWYESTKAELQILFPLVSKNGIVIIDDYGHWNGCKKAVDKYFSELEQPYFFNRIDYTGRLIVKQ